MASPTPAPGTSSNASGGRPLVGLVGIAAGVLAVIVVVSVTRSVLETTPPPPGAAEAAKARLQALRESESEALTRYQFDPRTGEERIPIRYAMDFRVIEGSKDPAATINTLPPEAYTSNPRIAEELKESPAIAKAINQSVLDLFGASPNDLKLPELKDSVFDKASVAHGATVYTRYCVNCHGTVGNGAGPTAVHYMPRPRDFRPGKFKFVSTGSGTKPTPNDLYRTVHNGLANAMPAFGSLLTDRDIKDVIAYTTLLSLRGESELAFLNEAATADESEAAKAKTPEEALGVKPLDVVQRIHDRWTAAKTITPAGEPKYASPESIARGRELFLDVKVGCVGCHGATAQGDGPSFIEKPIYDLVVHDKMTPEQAIRAYYAVLRRQTPPPADNEASFTEKKLTLWGQSVDDWGNPLRPANLTLGQYKGGSQPEDIYHRIAYGINGAKMPAHYPSLLQERQVWDVVNFVLNLPYEPKLVAAVPQKTAIPSTSYMGFGVYAIGGLAAGVMFFVWAVRSGRFPGLQRSRTTIFDENEPIGRPTEAFPAT